MSEDPEDLEPVADVEPIEVIDHTDSVMKIETVCDSRIVEVAKGLKRSRQPRAVARRRGLVVITPEDQRACRHSTHPRRTVAQCSLCSQDQGEELEITYAPRPAYTSEDVPRIAVRSLARMFDAARSSPRKARS